MTDTISERKNEHLDLCLTDGVESAALEPFSTIRLQHRAAPEMSFDDVSTEVTLLGKNLTLPLLVGSMTGGTERGAEINRRLAEAAQATGIGLALGSLRIGLTSEEALRGFDVRRYAPGIPLFANLGAVQLNYGVGGSDIVRVVKRLEVDGLFLHFNVIQECFQPGGNRDFSALLPKIAELCRDLPVPVLAKETGCGIDVETARRLIDVGVRAIDVSGRGGTAWALVEGMRSKDPRLVRSARQFAEQWGWSTAELLPLLRSALPTATIIASGGVRNGLDIAKALALGADVASISRPLLRPAETSSEAIVAEIEAIRYELKVAMLASASRDLCDLRSRLV